MTSNREFIAAYHARRAAATHHNPPFTPMSKSTIAAPSDTTVAVAQFEQMAKRYRDARDLVSERVDALNEEMRAIYKRRLAGIKFAVAEAQDAKAALAGIVETNKGMFVSPRTMTLHGITFGLKKGAGKMTWECEDDDLVERIEKQFKDDATALDLLILREKKPSKEGLESLDAKQLAKLGVKVEGVGDVVVVRSADTEVDKLVKRIIKEGEQHEVAAAA